jgi:SMODS and SLOG-associating 2TM effector domain
MPMSDAEKQSDPPPGSRLRRFLAAVVSGYSNFRQMNTNVSGRASGGLPDPEIARSGESFGPRTSTLRSIHASEVLPSNNKLLVFRSLTGIDNFATLTKVDVLERSAPNLGIYARVVSAEARAAREYKIFSLLINVCLGIQIIVAASLTALGAANGPHGVVTVFGAVNTIMAGILTYLKGSGLPDKQKRLAHEWTRIREYIEQREREFCLEGCLLDVQDVIDEIERMYEEVKASADASASENSFGARPRREFERASYIQPPPVALRKRETMRSRTVVLAEPEESTEPTMDPRKLTEPKRLYD